jgi:hypothetical protein
MSPTRIHYDEYPWALRIQHEGFLSLRLERQGRTLRFDPCEPVEDGDVVALSWTFPEQLDATRRAVADGLRPTVLAAGPVLDWLARAGEVDGHDLLGGPVAIDGMRVAATPYTPIPYATPAEAARKVQSALRNPGRAVGRLVRHIDAPRTAPLALEVDLGEVGRLLHLALSLHSGTPPDWLAAMQARAAGARWVIAGVDYDEEDAFLAALDGFRAEHLLVTDLVGEVRRRIGLPTRLLTPLVDQAVARGQPASVFATKSSFRYERLAAPPTQ